MLYVLLVLYLYVLIAVEKVPEQLDWQRANEIMIGSSRQNEAFGCNTIPST